ATRILATLDGGGNIVVPFDYLDVLPLGPGSPVARLLQGTATVDAFSSNPGVPIVLPSSSFVHSFTLDGRPLPPLLRATGGGAARLGRSGGARGVTRRPPPRGGGGPADLRSERSALGRGARADRGHELLARQARGGPARRPPLDRHGRGLCAR